MNWFENFFKHSKTGVFEAGAEYLYKTGHLIFLAIAIPSLIFLIYFLRNMEKAKFEKFLKISWVAITLTEIVKVVWMSFSLGYFDFGSMMSLYPCSTFMYIMPFAIYSKHDKIKQASLAYIATFVLFGGLTNFFVADVLRDYPVLSFQGFHTLIYHYWILLVGILLWVTKYYQPRKKDAEYAFLLLVVISIPIIIIDKIWNYNYFWYQDGGTTPLNIISQFFPNHWVWTVVMLLLYYVLIKLFYIPKMIQDLRLSIQK